MERLKLRRQDARKALDSLKEIIEEPFSEIVRDATIQRFEYTFEAFWKFLKDYLKQKEGAVVNAPKSCFRELFALGYCSEEETVQLQQMTDDRNETVHTYKKEVAKKIYQAIPRHAALMDKVLKSVTEKT